MGQIDVSVPRGMPKRGPTGAGMPFIQTTHLDMTYVTRMGERFPALDDVSFSAERGQFVTIVGPSGCGKSTLLKILAGLIVPSSGTVEVGGKPVQGPSQTVGVVFQSALLLDWRTVLENVLVPVEILKLPRKEYRERALELLGLTGLSEFASSYPSELSGGMQQRVAICRALVFEPEILLLDEPFGALDAMTRDFMNLELLRLWQTSGKTVVLITHSISEAVFLSDRVYVMSPRPGRIVDIKDIDIARPRALDVTSTPQFGRHVLDIRRYFTAEMFAPAVGGRDRR